MEPACHRLHVREAGPKPGKRETPSFQGSAFQEHCLPALVVFVQRDWPSVPKERAESGQRRRRLRGESCEAGRVAAGACAAVRRCAGSDSTSGMPNLEEERKIQAGQSGTNVANEEEEKEVDGARPRCSRSTENKLPAWQPDRCVAARHFLQAIPIAASLTGSQERVAGPACRD